MSHLSAISALLLLSGANVTPPRGAALGHQASVEARSEIDTSGAERLDGIAASLARGDPLRLQVERLGIFTGEYLHAQERRIYLQVGEEIGFARYDEIEKIWIRGKSTGIGAFLGGAIGYVVGGAFFAPESENNSLFFFGGAALAGAALGAAAGALIGNFVPMWSTKYP